MQVYFGVEIDTVNMAMRLPREKLDKLGVELDFFKDKPRASKKQIQKLCGVLYVASRQTYTILVQP